MIKIIDQAIYKKVINLSCDNSKFILKGPTGSGKSTLLLERYKHMINDMKVPSEKVLLLLLNRTQSLDWRKKTSVKASSTIWRTSYYGFIQSELKTYYPLILQNCPEIVNKRIKPIFLTFEAAQFLVSKVIEARRMGSELFSSVVSYSDQMALDLTGNLVRAAISDIPYDEIGKRLFNSLEAKDEIKKEMFRDVDEIITSYRKKCLKLGVLDYGMAIELYNKYLLRNPLYLKQLENRVQHLIVDNIEECVPTEVDFINLLLPNLKTCILGYNYEGGYGESFGSNHTYVKNELLEKLDTIDLDKSLTCNDYMSEFSEMLFDNIKNNKKNNLKENLFIEKNQEVDLRSDMLEKIGERVIKLIEDEGYKPSDIVILSTHADPVTEFVLERILERHGYGIKNLARKSRVIDNPFSQALITLAQLCHPKYNIYPNVDDVKDLIKMLLKIDPIRSSMLAEEVCAQRPFAEFPDIEFPGLVERIGYYNIEKYEYIRQWIKDYKSMEKPLPIDKFFQKVFLEILISKDIKQNDILQAKNLIDSASSFVDIITRFEMDANKNFLDMVRKGIKAAESIFELEEKLTGNFVTLSTPVAYLATTLKSKVTILSGISSKHWTPRSIKEMTNIHVLTKTWVDGEIYTEEYEEENQKRYLALILRTIIKKCEEKLITFESNLSASGYENDGILTEYFEEILAILYT